MRQNIANLEDVVWCYKSSNQKWKPFQQIGLPFYRTQRTHSTNVTQSHFVDTLTTHNLFTFGTWEDLREWKWEQKESQCEFKMVILKTKYIFITLRDSSPQQRQTDLDEWTLFILPLPKKCLKATWCDSPIIWKKCQIYQNKIFQNNIFKTWIAIRNSSKIRFNSSLSFQSSSQYSLIHCIIRLTTTIQNRGINCRKQSCIWFFF